MEVVVSGKISIVSIKLIRLFLVPLCNYFGVLKLLSPSADGEFESLVDFWIVSFLNKVSIYPKSRILY